MKTSSKSLFACLLFPTLLMGQKMQEKPVWQFDLHFDFAKADLKSEYHPRLDSLVVALQDSTFVVSMTAHTDSIGDAKANFALSQKRAQAVRNYLTSKNAPENRIHTEGVGETQPIAENQSDDGRQRNRRVSVSVLRRLAEVTGVVTDSDGKTPLAHAKVVLTSKFVRDSAFTDENGVYRLTARLNLPAKMRVVGNPINECTTFDGQIFTVDKWVTTQNFALKCKTKPVVTMKKAPMKVTISGTVTNDSAQIVQHARLVFSNDNGKDTVFSDDKGHYSVSNLMYSDVRVGIAANNHLPFYQGIVADSTTKKVDFKIQTIAVGKKAALQNISFYYGSYQVMTESEPALTDLVQFLSENPNYHFEVRGHITSSNPDTFPIGNIRYDLSYNRAKAIYEYLIDHGIKEERMTYKGYSNYEMVFPYPKNEEEHRANRRVEIKIISGGTK